jgi:hypothetical protein
MKQDSKTRQLGPQPSVPDPRRHLLSAVLTFVRAARSSPGVLRIALLGSLSTHKPVPKDADVLVTIDAAMDLSSLARFGRRLKGTAQTINLGADIFLADRSEHYLGRICHYRECHPRAACRALHCGQPATSERRSPDRDVEPLTYQCSTYRSVAAHHQARYRAGRYRGALGGAGER